MKKARNIIVYKSNDEQEKSAYEGDDETAQFLFNKRKFFSLLVTVRLNELIKQYGLYQKGAKKREKIDKLCALSNAEDIIFYEIYLHRYGSIEEFEKAIKAVPKKKKRGRPKGSKNKTSH